MSPARSARSASPAWLVPGLALGLVLAAAGCAWGHPAQHRPQPSVRAFAAESRAIARPANHRLDVAVEAYADHAHHNLAAAGAALRFEAATERQFDRQLAAITFPPAIAATASALIRVNEIPARMTEPHAPPPPVPPFPPFTAAHN